MAHSRRLGNGTDSLTLVPPSMIGPPEKIHIHRKNTRIPAIVSTVSAKGQSHGSRGNSVRSTIGIVFHRTPVFSTMS